MSGAAREMCVSAKTYIFKIALCKNNNVIVVVLQGRTSALQQNTSSTELDNVLNIFAIIRHRVIKRECYRYV